MGAKTVLVDNRSLAGQVGICYKMKAEVEGLQVRIQPGQHSKTLSHTNKQVEASRTFIFPAFSRTIIYLLLFKIVTEKNERTLFMALSRLSVCRKTILEDFLTFVSYGYKNPLSFYCIKITYKCYRP